MQGQEVAKVKWDIIGRVLLCGGRWSWGNSSHFWWGNQQVIDTIKFLGCFACQMHNLEIKRKWSSTKEHFFPGLLFQSKSHLTEKLILSYHLHFSRQNASRGVSLSNWQYSTGLLWGLCTSLLNLPWIFFLLDLCRLLDFYILWNGCFSTQ